MLSQHKNLMEPPAAKKVRVHFGSFAEQEKKKLEERGGATNGGSEAAVLAGIKAGNINIDGRCALTRKLRYSVVASICCACGA